MAVESGRGLYACALAASIAWSCAYMSAASIASELDTKLSIDPDLIPPDSFRATEELQLEMNPAYKSRAIGKKQKWQLDRGQFQDSAPVGTSVYDPELDSYSGIRFRLPRQR